MRQRRWLAAAYVAAVALRLALLAAGGLLIGHQRGNAGVWEAAGLLVAVGGCLAVTKTIGVTIEEALSDPPWRMWLLRLLLFSAVMAGLGVTAWWGPWYQIHHGRTTAAVVEEYRCDPAGDYQCLDMFRLIDLRTERNLGWFYCEHLRLGQQVTVRGSGSDWFAPVVAGCTPDETTVVPVAAAVTGPLVALIVLIRLGAAIR